MQKKREKQFDATRLISVEQYVDLLRSAKITRPLGQAKMLCVKEFWELSEIDFALYDWIRTRFGEDTLQHMAMRALDRASIPVRESLTMPNIESALLYMRAEAMAISYHGLGFTEACLSSSGEFLWRWIDCRRKILTEDHE